MTDRWLNYVLAVVVVIGLVAVARYQQPRLAEERAEFLDQEVAIGDPDTPPVEDRDPLELRTAPDNGEPAAEEPVTEPLGAYGVSASHPLAVEVGMDVLAAGGNAVDAAIAVSYALAIVEPFGSGVGGGGAMLLHEPGEAPLAYDYRETAPQSGDRPASDIGVPGFVAGMEHVHAAHGTIELADLIEPAARYAEDGFEVDPYLHERARDAAFRMPIHILPGLFPGGAVIEPGETLRQLDYAEVLRMIQDQGADVMYGGEIGQRIADEVTGLSVEDLEAYEVAEVQPAIGSFAGYDVVSGAPPISGTALIQTLQIAEERGIADLELDSTEGIHTMAQAYRLAQRDRRVNVGDPSIEDVPLDAMLASSRTQEMAALIPDDGFVELPDEEDVRFASETDTTHVVVVDEAGMMVSLTNTLSNFFGSGLPVSGFFLNDQLKNFSPDPESINAVAPGKRPRSFITPTILAQDGRPILGIGSAGGRRIPFVTAQVLTRWAAHGEDLESAVAEPRFHLEVRDLEVEDSLAGDVESELAGRGYEITYTVPTTEYFGGMQGLVVDPDAGTVDGVADERRAGAWASSSS
jgi:gamma-glutamyltranspeptidase / glutathione hydrolase